MPRKSKDEEKRRDELIVKALLMGASYRDIKAAFKVSQDKIDRVKATHRRLQPLPWRVERVKEQLRPPPHMVDEASIARLFGDDALASAKQTSN